MGWVNEHDDGLWQVYNFVGTPGSGDQSPVSLSGELSPSMVPQVSPNPSPGVAMPTSPLQNSQHRLSWSVGYADKKKDKERSVLELFATFWMCYELLSFASCRYLDRFAHVSWYRHTYGLVHTLVDVRLHVLVHSLAHSLTHSVSHMHAHNCMNTHTLIPCWTLLVLSIWVGLSMSVPTKAHVRGHSCSHIRTQSLTHTHTHTHTRLLTWSLAHSLHACR